MKKILGFLSVAAFATVLFLAGNNIKETNDSDLASLLSMSTANAETTAYGCRYTGYSGDYCNAAFGTMVTGCGNSSITSCAY